MIAACKGHQRSDGSNAHTSIYHFRYDCADRRSELVRSGLRIAIVGAPNVGKSTILNHLAGRRAAIVSAIPGTTRDAIEVTLDISGYKVRPIESASGVQSCMCSL